MNATQWAIAISLGLFLGMVACLELGYRIGRSGKQRDPDSAHEGVGTIEAAIFALLGLLLGFSFAGGTSRLDARRQLIVQEANAIGTAYFRVDELPAADQPELRRLFRDYLDARLSVYEKHPNEKGVEEELARGAQLQQEIWTKAVIGSRDDPTQNSARLLLPAINEMMDITTTRTIALQTHLPLLIFGLLICVALLSALLAGYAMSKRKTRSWLHVLLYAAVVSLTVYAVLDLDNPRFGWIQLQAADRALHQLRDSIR